MALSLDRYDTFVVRILSREGGVVHGQITHVATRQSIRFRDAQRMFDFIAEHLRMGCEPALLDLEPEGPQ